MPIFDYATFKEFRFKITAFVKPGYYFFKFWVN